MESFLLFPLDGQPRKVEEKEREFGDSGDGF
jgi:hypothetical protein